MVSDENTGREAGEGQSTDAGDDPSKPDERRHEGGPHEGRRYEGRPHEERRHEPEGGPYEGRPHPPAGTGRYEGRRPSEGEFERPVGPSSYRGRYGSRIPKHEREENDEGGQDEKGRKIEVREAGEESKDEGGEEVEGRNEEEERRTSETGEIPKYGGPRDPEWKRRRRLLREQVEQRQRQHDEEIRQYEWRTNAALTRRGDLQVGKDERRYHRGRR